MEKIPVVVNFLHGSSIFLTSPVVLMLKISAASRRKDLALIICDSQSAIPVGFDDARSKQIAVLASVKSNPPN